eukprot:GEMP01038032.1.p1 GENE.GEMP01038032.1~~GEMP01038032.1.p1  ORF type:complete len:329 (+),score=65.91 GEMP01038032.1:157-1143(+)
MSSLNLTDARFYGVKIVSNMKERHGGRGVFAEEHIPLGMLVLEEKPLITAEDYDSLLHKARSISDEPTLTVLGTMYPQGKGAARCDAVIAHNWHSVDPPPINGQWAKQMPIVGLWPNASLINHDFRRPNVTRTFRTDGADMWVQYRAIREIASGEEVFDNYLDLRCAFEHRMKVERDQHGIESERDGFDEPLLPQILNSLMHIRSQYLEDSEGPGFLNMLSLTEEASKLQDPAISEVFLTFSEMADKEGMDEYALNGEAQALELVSKREPFSNWTVLLLSRMALRTKSHDASTHSKLRELCEQHCDIVYGEGSFDRLVSDLACASAST